MIEALARSPALGRVRGALREHSVAVAVLVGVLLVAAVAARVLLNRSVLAPWIQEDELQYAEMAKSFAATGEYLFRGQPHHVMTIYPALIAPAWWTGSMTTTYALAKAFNVVLMTLAAVPLYLWARRLVSPAYAVLAVVLLLAMPGFVYTGEILTENAYVPAVVLALFAIAVAIERPSLLHQLLALGATALAVAVRLQGLVLLLVIPTAVALSLLLEAVASAPGERRRRFARRIRQFWPMIGGIVVAVLAYVAYESVRGATVSSGLGVYRSVTQANYSFLPAVRWIVYQLGELAFAVGLVPVAALVVLLGLASRRATSPGEAERAFVAVATAAVVWTVVEVGTFASHFSLRVEERYVFNVFPVLFLALAVWLARGLPRPAGLTAVAVLVPTAFLLALPYETLVSTGAFFTDTFGLIPLWRLISVLPGGAGDARILVGAAALAAGLLFAGLPRRSARVVVPAAVAGYLMLASGSVFAQVTFISRATRHAGGLAGDPSWIDHAIGRDKRVEFLYTTEIDRDQHILWQAEFWNRSMRRVFGVTSQDPSIPDVTAPLDPETGRIRPQLPANSPDLAPRYVVAASNLDVAGTRVATEGVLTLFRVHGALRLNSLTAGVQPDGWSGSSAAYTRYAAPARGGHIVVTVSRPRLIGPPPARISLAVGRVGTTNGVATITRVWRRRSWMLRNGSSRRFDLPLRRGPFQVQLAVNPPFVPSQYGLTDTRTLGVQVSFSVER